MPIKFLAVAALIVAGMSSPARAAPVTWLVDGFAFDDGGLLAGSFTFDAALGRYSQVHLVTTAGSAAPGSAYEDLLPGAAGNSGLLAAVSDTDVWPGHAGLLVLLWESPLGLAGSATTGLRIGFERYFTDGRATPGLRMITRVGEVHAAPLPEPGSVALASVALLALLASGALRSGRVRAGSSPA